MESNKLSDFLKKEYSNMVSYVKSRWSQYQDIEAEDIVQDVATRIFEKMDINAPIENLAAYFYRSLRNKVIDLSRKKREISISNASTNEELADKSEQEKQQLVYSEKRIEMMFDAMEELKPLQKEIIVLSEIEGYTFDEISQETGIPLGTLLSRKHRAMTKLEQIINSKLSED